jgi:hypothetical protein
MQLSLRLIILAGAVVIIATVLRYIRKRRILMTDATGWVCLAAFLLLIALFPSIMTRAASWLGFISPANFVFFLATGLLVIKAFRDSARMSLMQHRISELAQELALARDEAMREADGGTASSPEATGAVAGAQVQAASEPPREMPAARVS